MQIKSRNILVYSTILISALLAALLIARFKHDPESATDPVAATEAQRFALGKFSASDGIETAALPCLDISIEVSPGFCSGNCEQYVLTLFRDKPAQLQTGSTILSGTSPDSTDFVKLCQLASLARRSASHFDAADVLVSDAGAKTLRVTFTDSAWEYQQAGGVAPPEVWAINEILQSRRESIDWQPR